MWSLALGGLAVSGVVDGENTSSTMYLTSSNQLCQRIRRDPGSKPYDHAYSSIAGQATFRCSGRSTSGATQHPDSGIYTLLCDMGTLAEVEDVLFIDSESARCLSTTGTKSKLISKIMYPLMADAVISSDCVSGAMLTITEETRLVIAWGTALDLDGARYYLDLSNFELRYRGKTQGTSSGFQLSVLADVGQSASDWEVCAKNDTPLNSRIYITFAKTPAELDADGP